MAYITVTYTITNGTTADATQVATNYTDILNGLSDGTKDISISAGTFAGTLTANGHVNLGNASADDLTITASLASSIPIKTNNSYDVGSATLGLRKLYLGNGGAGATCSIVSASHATTREYTVPDCGAAATFLLTKGNTVTSQVVVDSGHTANQGVGTSNTRTRRYMNASTTGSDITYAESAASGSSFTINTAGLYLITLCDRNDSAAVRYAVMLNSTANPDSVGPTVALTYTETSAATVFTATATIAWLAVNDVIRIGSSSTTGHSTSASVQARIVKVL